MDNLVTACQPCNLLKGKRVYKSLQEAKEYVLAKREEWRQALTRSKLRQRGKDGHYARQLLSRRAGDALLP